MNATNDEIFLLFLRIANGELSRDAVGDFFRDPVVVNA